MLLENFKIDINDPGSVMITATVIINRGGRYYKVPYGRKYEYYGEKEFTKLIEFRRNVLETLREINEIDSHWVLDTDFLLDPGNEFKLKYP